MSTPKALAPHWRLVWKRRAARTGRWLHIYASMASFTVVFFFAATGLTLNHANWFANQPRTIKARGTLEKAWMNMPGEPGLAKQEIVDFLRREHGIGGEVNNLDADESQIALSFRGPGYSADAFIDRTTGRYDLTESRLGFAAIINDLHKGRDTGKLWSVVIDVSAVLLVFIALTGLLLIWFVHKHRFAGLLALAGGAMVTFCVYRLFVP
jgi:uncharacterized protein